MHDEVLFHCGISKEISPSLLSLERVLETLDATQAVLQHIHLHSRGTPRVPPQLTKSPVFPSSSRDEGPFPCTSREGSLNLKLKRNSRGLATIQKDPDVPVHSRYTLSHALTRLSSRVSTQKKMACVTACQEPA